MLHSKVRSINTKSNDRFLDPPHLLEALSDDRRWEEAAVRAAGSAPRSAPISSPARRDLHRRAAFALARVEGAEIQAAHHAVSAGEAIHFGDALEMVVRTGVTVLDRAMAEAAAQLYDRAIQAFRASHHLDPSTNAWLHVARYKALDESGDPRADASFQRSIDQIRLLEDPHLAVELAAARLGRTSDGDGRLRDLLLLALDWIEPNDHGARADVLAQLALETAEWVGGTRPTDMAAEAIDLASLTPGGPSQKLALRAMLATCHQRLRADERLELSTEMLELAFQTGDPDYQLVVSANRLTDLHAARRWAEVEVLSSEIVDLARQRHRRRFTAFVLANRAAVACARGDRETQLRWIDELRRACDGTTFPDIEVALVGQDIVRTWREGEIGRYADILDAIWDESAAAPIHAAALAAALAAVGDGARAARVLSSHFGERLELVPHGTLYLGTLALTAAAVVELGDAALAQALLLLFSPHRGNDIVVAGGGGIFGPVEAITGELHRVLGHHEESRRDLLVAREASLLSGFGPLAARLDGLLDVIPG